MKRPVTTVGVIVGLAIAAAVALWIAAVAYKATHEIQMRECRERGGAVVLSEYGHGWTCE